MYPRRGAASIYGKERDYVSIAPRRSAAGELNVRLTCIRKVIQFSDLTRFNMPFSVSSDEQIRAFIDKHRALLAQERETEIERTSLLLTNCPPSLLEQKGLALGGLSVSNVTVGLGGKTCAFTFTSTGTSLT